MLSIFPRLNIGDPSAHVIQLSAGLRLLGCETRLVVGMESPREGNRLPLAAEKNVTFEAMGGLGRDFSSASAAFFCRPETLDQSEAARARALAGREHVLARHSADRLVRDVDALYRELRAAKKAA